MGFSHLAEHQQVVTLLQRSLDRGRLGHAYLISSSRLEPAEKLARTLAKTLNCQSPPQRSPHGIPLDSCDQCRACTRIDSNLHADVHWLRPESKSRILTIDQIRELEHALRMKPMEGLYKVAVVVAADRMTDQAANAFLKTLEEPPSQSVMLLLSTEPRQVLETVVSRCLRVNLGGGEGGPRDLLRVEWLRRVAQTAAENRGSLLGRYQLLTVLLTELARLRDAIRDELEARSSIQSNPDVEPELRKRWESELDAAVEAEYRRQRGEVLASIQWWLRDVWLLSRKSPEVDTNYPELAHTSRLIAARVSPEDAMGNLDRIDRLQRLLGSNVQEALALEVGLLQLRL